MRIGILFGGNSVEHDISILTMLQVAHAINKDKYEIILIYLTKDGRFLVGPKFLELKTFQGVKYKSYQVALFKKATSLYLKGIGRLPRKYRKKIDVILPLVHGKNLEDGSLAGFFKVLGITYASSMVLPAAVFQNKYLTKKLLEKDNIKTVPYFHLRKADFIESLTEVYEKLEELSYPVIIKPVSLGSSVGIKIARTLDEAKMGLIYGFKFEDEVIVEKKLENYQEFNQAVLKTVNGLKLSFIEEVKGSDDYLSFDDKYISEKSVRVIPASISSNFVNEISLLSKRIFSDYNFSGVIRIDYLYDKITDTLYVNEVNTIPGSLAYYLFEEFLSFESLIDEVILASVRDKYLDDLKLNSFSSSVLSSKRILKK